MIRFVLLVTIACFANPFYGCVLSANLAYAQCVVEDLVIQGEDVQVGIFDPSLEYDAAANKLWMTYSRVRARGGNPLGYVDNHLASSLDNGNSWTFEMEINPSFDDVGTGGYWRQEVSTLIHDAADPDPSARWKLYWYEFHVTSGGLEEHGVKSWISVRSAPTPTGPWSSKELLFGTSFLDSQFSAQVVANGLDPSLAGLVAVTEPGAIMDSGTIFVAMAGAFAPVTFPFIDIFLLKSDDQGATWTFVSMIITRQDAGALGIAQFQAPDIVRIGTDFYLLATPVEPVAGGEQYAGVSVFRFVDLATGQLERDGNGDLIEIEFIDPEPVKHRGAGGFDPEATGSGVIVSQLRPGGPAPLFNLVKTCEVLTVPIPQAGLPAAAGWAVGLLVGACSAVGVWRLRRAAP